MNQPLALRVIGVPTANTTPLPRLVARWQRDMTAVGKSPRTIGDRVECVMLLARHAEVAPHEATEEDILGWLAAQEHWSQSTRYTRFTQIAAWFRWLHVGEHIETNPMARIPRPAHALARPRPFSPEHMRLIVGVRMHKRTRVMVYLAVCQGLRVHEIAKVKGEDVDLIDRTITVTGKGNKTETLPLHPLVADLASCMPGRGWWFPSNSTREGEHVLGRSVSDIVRKVIRRAGIHRGSAHAMRHTYATQLLDQGTELLVVKELMRHSSAATTQRYVRVADDRPVAAINSFDPFRGREPRSRLADRGESA